MADEEEPNIWRADYKLCLEFGLFGGLVPLTPLPPIPNVQGSTVLELTDSYQSKSSGAENKRMGRFLYSLWNEYHSHTCLSVCT